MTTTTTASIDMRRFRNMMDYYCEVRFTRDANGWVRDVRLVDSGGASFSLPMPTHDSDDREMSCGFEWGYGGQGPHALAWALVGLVAKRSHRYGLEAALRGMGYQPGLLVSEFVANLPRSGDFSISRDALEAAVAGCKVEVAS